MLQVSVMDFWCYILPLCHYQTIFVLIATTNFRRPPVTYRRAVVAVLPVTTTAAGSRQQRLTAVKVASPACSRCAAQSAAPVGAADRALWTAANSAGGIRPVWSVVTVACRGKVFLEILRILGAGLYRYKQFFKDHKKMYL